MANWSDIFESFMCKTCDINEYSWAVCSMKLFPQWATKYWCEQIWEHGSELTPIELIEKSRFSSFFFRPCASVPFITTLYMQVWCGVHMAYFLYHKDIKSARLFMSGVGMSQDFHAVLKNIPICDVGQGDWKCSHCSSRTVKGNLHVCVLCSNPITNWTKYV